MCKTSTLPTDVSPAMGAPSIAHSHVCAQAASLSVLSGMITNLLSTSISQTLSQGRDTGRLGPHRMQIKVIGSGYSHSVSRGSGDSVYGQQCKLAIVKHCPEWEAGAPVSQTDLELPK